MTQINKKHLISKVGEYNAGVYSCKDCDVNLVLQDHHGSVADNIIGFTSDGFAVWECPQCFSKWYFHARLYMKHNWYNHFLNSIEFGTNKHYK